MFGSGRALFYFTLWSVGLAKWLTYKTESALETGKCTYFDLSWKTRSSSLIKLHQWLDSSYISILCAWTYGLWVGREEVPLWTTPPALSLSSLVWGPAGPTSLNGVSPRIKKLSTADCTMNFWRLQTPNWGSQKTTCIRVAWVYLKKKKKKQVPRPHLKSTEWEFLGLGLRNTHWRQVPG